MFVNLATATTSTPLETVKKKRVVASADRSSIHQIVIPVRTATLGIPTVVLVSAILMEQLVITAKLSMGSVHVSQTSVAITVGSVPMAITIFRIVNLVDVTKLAR